MSIFLQRKIRSIGQVIATSFFCVPAFGLDINSNDYNIYYGDFNDDGLSRDVYFHDKDFFVFIHGEISIPLLIGSDKSFAFYEGDDTSHQLRLTTSALEGFDQGTFGTDYDLSDINGDGFDDIRFASQLDFGFQKRILGRQGNGVEGLYACDLGAIDSDGDSLCNDEETFAGTDPFDTDTDGDSLSDTIELLGGYGGVDLESYGVNPLKKDKLIEIDYYPGLAPSEDAIQMVIDAFAIAPVGNPDGSTGIHLVIDVDDEIDAADVDNDLAPVWTDFDVIKNAYLPENREDIFHYGLFANQYAGGTSSGISRGISASDFVVTLGNWSTPGGTVQQQAGTLMHEIGHNLGLLHGGDENMNRKGNYISIMSYTFQLGGLQVAGESGVLDYSRLQIARATESNLNEVNAFTPVNPTTEALLSNYSVRLGSTWLNGNASTNLDFDNDGVIDMATVSVDLNNDGDTTDIINASPNDWNNIDFTGGGNIGDPLLGASETSGSVLLKATLPEHMDACMSEFD